MIAIDSQKETQQEYRNQLRQTVGGAVSGQTTIKRDFGELSVRQLLMKTSVPDQ
jgi:hypothetical protein